MHLHHLSAAMFNLGRVSSGRTRISALGTPLLLIRDGSSSWACSELRVGVEVEADDVVMAVEEDGQLKRGQSR